MMPGRARMFGRQKTMQDFADRLTGVMSRTSDGYDRAESEIRFHPDLFVRGNEWVHGPDAVSSRRRRRRRPAASLPEAEPLPDIFGAVQAQLGLGLEPKKESVSR